MHKVRIIPTLLTDGKTLVKGQEFNSWRSVGSIAAAARLFAMRDVDELLLLDVDATKEKRLLDLRMIDDFASILQVPFAVGGGVRSTEDIRKYLRAGAEKVVIGSAAFEDSNIIREAADLFGTQAIVVSVDIVNLQLGHIAIHSGKRILTLNVLEEMKRLQDQGAGEILLQSIKHDGKMLGMNFDAISEICRATNLPVIASSGAGQYSDFSKAIDCGAASVAAGAVFQFNEMTPRAIRKYLQDSGIEVRIS